MQEVIGSGMEQQEVAGISTNWQRVALSGREQQGMDNINWLGVGRSGAAWQGVAGSGREWQGLVVWQGVVGSGRGWQGVAGHSWGEHTLAGTQDLTRRGRRNGE